MRRAPIATLIALCLYLAALPASADAVDSAVASARGSGLRSVPALESTANGSAANQAAAADLFHAGLGHLTATCTRSAEIVGTGPTVQLIFMGFQTSPTHWSVLTDPAWTAMGTGLATGSDGALYVSVVFCAEATAPPPPPPPPPPEAEPQPEPEPAPEPPPTAPAPGPAPTAEPASPSPTRNPIASSPAIAPLEPVVEIDVARLLATMLSTSLDSLTATVDDDSPVAMQWDQFFVLQAGHPVIV